MREIVPVGEAPRHARSGPAQVLRRIGGDRRPGREPVTTEGGDDNAGIARARDRDLTRGRAPDQRHAFCPRPDLPQQGLQVMRLRAENHQEFRVAVQERVTGCPRSRPGLGSLGVPDPEPAIRLHVTPKQESSFYRRYSTATAT